MDAGYNPHLTDVFGLPTNQVLFRILRAVIGYIHLMAGRGLQIITGVGRLSTMVAGLMIRFMDGCGFLAMNGGRHGYPGEQGVVIMVGALSVREWVLE